MGFKTIPISSTEPVGANTPLENFEVMREDNYADPHNIH